MRRRAATLIALVVVAGCSGSDTTAGPDPSRGPTASSDAPRPGLPDPPSGSRWVGVQDVALAVPAAWEVTTAPCPTGRDEVRLLGRDAGAVRCALPVLPTVASLEVRTRDTGDLVTATLEERVTPTGTLHLSLGEPVCQLSQPGSCLVSFAVAEVDARWELRVPDRLLDLAGTLPRSVTPLPEGWTSVPAVSPSEGLRAWERQLRRAGLRPVASDGGDSPLTPTGTAPSAGTIVPVGSRVRVLLAGG